MGTRMTELRPPTDQLYQPLRTYKTATLSIPDDMGAPGTHAEVILTPVDTTIPQIVVKVPVSDFIEAWTQALVSARIAELEQMDHHDVLIALRKYGRL